MDESERAIEGEPTELWATDYDQLSRSVRRYRGHQTYPCASLPNISTNIWMPYYKKTSFYKGKGIAITVMVWEICNQLLQQ